jgi:drug/metabolite transporter (DMT)-like permease
MNDSYLLLLAVVSGMSFSLVGLSFRCGITRGAEPIHLTVFTALSGALFYGIRVWASSDGPIPPLVIAMAVAAGLGQYVIARLMKVALGLGPLSPLWCATMLSFVPAIAYASIVLGEPFTPLHLLAVAAATGSVVFAGRAQGAAAKAQADGGEVKPFRYAAVLVAILALNSLPGIALKEMGMRVDAAGATYLSRHTDAFFAFFFLSMGIGVVTDIVIARRRPESLRWVMVLGGVTSFAAVVGTLMLGWCAMLPAAAVFTANSVASILFTAVMAALIFRETRTPAWYATLACGALAIALTNGPAFLRMLTAGR